MATAIRTVSTSASVSPVATGDRQNDAPDTLAYLNYRRVAEQQAAADGFVGALSRSFTAPADTELLNLSPQALLLLNGIEAEEETLQAQGRLPLPPVPPALTPGQQERLADIVTRYSSSPFDWNTFLEVRQALRDARINPHQLSLFDFMHGADEEPYLPAAPRRRKYEAA